MLATVSSAGAARADLVNIFANSTGEGQPFTLHFGDYGGLHGTTSYSKISDLSYFGFAVYPIIIPDGTFQIDFHIAPNYSDALSAEVFKGSPYSDKFFFPTLPYHDGNQYVVRFRGGANFGIAYYTFGYSVPADDPSRGNPYVGYFTVSPGVPEPSTWAMMVLGLFGVALTATRRWPSPKLLTKGSGSL